MIYSFSLRSGNDWIGSNRPAKKVNSKKMQEMNVNVYVQKLTLVRCEQE